MTNWIKAKHTDISVLSGNYYPLAQRALWKLSSTQTHSPPSSSALRHPPCLPLWRVCGRRQTCPAGLCAAPRGEQSLGFCLRAGGRPGRSPLGRTLPFGPAARPPPAACLHWCMYSTRDRGWGERDGLTQEDDIMQVKHILNTSRDGKNIGREKMTNRICRRRVHR